MTRSHLAVVVLGGVLLSFIVYTVFGQYTPIATTTSPNQTYVLRLTGQKSRPKVPLVVHSVYFDLFKNNEPVALKKPLHSGFWLDASFEILYPTHSWVSDSVVMFKRGSEDEYERDTLILSNNTTKEIRSLRVEAGDLFLLFDLKPGSRTKLSAYPQTSLSWIAAEGEFDGGEIISKQGTNFSIEPEMKGPFQYEISINEDGLRIESPQLRKYEP